MLRRCLTGLFVLLITSTVFAAEPGFEPVLKAINAYRGDTSKAVSIRFTDKTFQALQRAESPLQAKDAEARLPKDAVPRLKIADKGNWIEYTAGDGSVISRPIASSGGADSTRSWKRTRWVPVATFERSAWPDVIEFAIANGMSGVREARYAQGPELALSFAPTTPLSIDGGARKLELNDTFRATMRLSPQYPPYAGTKGFVILLHDPHENVAGRFQTLSGLRALVSANRSVRFQFLIEGAYTGPSRQLGLAGLENVIKPGMTGAVVVNKLLSQYMLNTPTAYRLLYDRTIESWAIDDNELLTYDAPRPVRPVLEQFRSLQRIAVAVDQSPLQAGVKASLQDAFTIAFIYLGTDVSDAPDAALADYFATLQKIFRAIADVGRELRAGGAALNQADLSGLAADADGFGDQFLTFRKALERNKTMAPQIIVRATAGTGQLPIAFIGNYHTPAIVDALRRASVGYVVIEPRLREPSTEAESRAFDKANHPNTRGNYLSTIKLNMGWNLPTPSEVDSYFVPKINATAARADSMRTSLVAGLGARPDSVIQVDKLIASMSENGSLGSITASAGGSSPPPPDKFAQAFAYFDPGDAAGGRGRGTASSAEPRLVIADPRDVQWKDNDRYDFLRVGMFRRPQESFAGATTTSNLVFYPIAGSNRLFITMYDAGSRRTYCFEGTAQLAASLVAVPIVTANKSVDVRVQITKLIVRIRMADHG